MYIWPKVNHNQFTFLRGTSYRETYQTEHVFEAQTITRFFTMWLLNDATTIRTTDWVEENFFKPHSGPLMGNRKMILRDRRGTRLKSSPRSLDRAAIQIQQHEGEPVQRQSQHISVKVQ